MHISEPLERVRSAKYDTIYLPSQISNKKVQAFCEPIGVGIFTKNGRKNKDYTDTNMLQYGCLEAPHQLAVERISCYFIGQTGILPIKSRWYAESVLSFRVNCREIVSAPLSEFAGHAAIFADSKPVKGMSPIDLESYESEQIKKFFDPPVVIETQMTFSASVEFSDWADGDFGLYPDKLVIALWGDLFRPVL